MSAIDRDPGATQAAASLAGFVDRWCLNCHAGDEAEGSVDFEPLWTTLDAVARGADADPDELVVAWAAVDPSLLRAMRPRLVSQDMPPGRRRPADAAYGDAIAHLDAVLRDSGAARDGRAGGGGLGAGAGAGDGGGGEGGVRAGDDGGRGADALGVEHGRGLEHAGGVMRRLTRIEYANAVRDVFGVHFDPESLPTDEIGHGFDTNGDVAALPPLLFEQYVEAAEAIAVKAVADVGRGPVRREYPAADLEVRSGGAVQGNVARLWSNGVAATDFDASAAGRYRIRAEVAGEQAGPDRVRVSIVGQRNGGPIATHGTFRVDGQREWTWVEAEATLEAGPQRLGAAFINDYYDPDAANPRERDRNAAVRTLIVEGPLEPPTPTALQQRLAAAVADVPAARRERAALASLARLAWRRPVGDDELDRLLGGIRRAVAVAARAERDALSDDGERRDGGRRDVGRRDEARRDGTQRREGRSRPVRASEEARAQAAARAEARRRAEADGHVDPDFLRTTIVALLIHPRFVFHVEPGADGGAPRPLDGYEIAARLAATLWSSTPDDALLDAAARGDLETDAGRHATVRRMLDDPRSFALAEHFAVQWLRIRPLLERSPDPDRFDGVDVDLQESMRMETVLFFDDVVRARRPIWDLLTASDTWLNEELAAHYGIPGVHGPHMRRVSVATQPGAAGLGVLRHGSILLTTSNPTRTSPVKRGKWVLEAILDDPPPPAPADVPALPRDGEIHGDESLREMLERHRQDPACSVCHQRMDPLGFALESFDAVGRLRATDAGIPIDSLASLPDGTVLDGPAGLRDVLMNQRRRDVARSLARHLATFALGRGLAGEADERLLDRMADRVMDADRPTIESMVQDLVASRAFLFRTAVGRSARVR